MPVPILLIAGFLGAGKTTVINHLLANAGGRRIAAVVNDFGAINIDAELIAGVGDGPSDGVISLANGCICCSLEGDLLRTLAAILRRSPRPEHIVIETSGVADPAEIVRNLMDPVIWREAPLEAVLCVVDASAPAEALNDALLRAQLRAADVVALSKLDLADAAGARAARAAVAAIRPAAVIVDAGNGRVPLALLFPDDPGRPPIPRDPGRRRPASDRFETLSWTSEQPVSLPRLQAAIGRVPLALLFPDDPGRPPVARDPSRRRLASDRFETFSWTSEQPVSLPRLQAAIGRLAPRLARAKGLFEAVEQPGRQFLFQLAGGRATLGPAGTLTPGAPRARIVFIAEIGVLSTAEISRIMDPCASTGPG